MIKLENTKVLGWEHAIRGMRNPMNSWAKSDSGWNTMYEVDDAEERSKYLLIQEEDEYEYFIGPNDQDLMTRLRNAGSDHRKFMRMITVYVDITAPLYWWKEFDTYKVGTVANSCSTMHKIASKKFTLEDFSHEHLDDEFECVKNPCADPYEGDFKTSIGILLDTIEALNWWRKQYFHQKEIGAGQDRLKWCWWQMIQLLPTSYNQRRTVMLNYEVLTNIYKSRRNHKLDEWHIFCDWIENLPYSEIIIKESEEKKDLKDFPISDEIMEEAKRRVLKEIEEHFNEYQEQLKSGFLNKKINIPKDKE